MKKIEIKSCLFLVPLLLAFALLIGLSQIDFACFVPAKCPPTANAYVTPIGGGLGGTATRKGFIAGCSVQRSADSRNLQLP